MLGPDTLEPLGFCPDFTCEQVDATIQKVHQELSSWKATTPFVRSRILEDCHTAIQNNSDHLGYLLSCENGKSLAEAKSEVLQAASYFKYYSEEIKRLKGEVYPSSTGRNRLMVTHEPVGVCALITPWNFPMSMMARKAAPALASGCTVVAKPDPRTPLCTVALANLLYEAGIPQDVFRVVTGSIGEATQRIGHVLMTHPLINKISFTGSTKVGQLIMSEASSTMKRLSLELGGHAPLIVFEDADMDLAVEGIIFSRFFNAGQKCISANRLIIHEGIYDGLMKKLVGRVGGLKVGSALDGADIGPLISHQARDDLLQRLDGAVQDGAKILYGGRALLIEGFAGAFLEPTLISCLSLNADLMQNEIFGPVAVVTTFTDEEEAVRLANKSAYGLASYVYTADSERGLRIAERLETGMVGINETVISTTEAPFGGIKMSGFGREGSQQGLMEYMNVKYINIRQ